MDNIIGMNNYSFDDIDEELTKRFTYSDFCINLSQCK